MKAPSTTGDFTLSTKIGLDTTPNNVSNFATKTLTVAAAFFVDTSHDIVTGDELFDVFGEIGTTNPLGDYLVGIIVSHKTSNYLAIEYFDIFDPVNPDGGYLIADLFFPPTALEGVYVVTATLLEGFVPVDTAIKEIEYRLPPFEVITSQTVIIDDTPFDVYGSIGFENPNGDYQVGFVIYLQGTNDPVLTRGADPVDIDGSYFYDDLVFPSIAEEGIYIVEVSLIDAGYNIVGTAQTEIEYIVSSLPASTVTRLTINSFGGGTPNITYNEGVRHRINARATLTVYGTAYDANNIPVAGAEITVTIKNTSASFYTSGTGTATTDGNGNFTAYVSAPQAAGANNRIVETNPTIRHWYDLGTVTANIGSVSSSAVPIYIYSHSTYN